MNEDLNYLIRQLLLIRKNIDFFKNSKIDLFLLVSNLRSILMSIYFDDEKWSSLIETEINNLEYVHDSLIDGSISGWTQNPEEVILSSLKTLSSLIQEKLNTFLKLPSSVIRDRSEIIDSNWLLCTKCNEVWENGDTENPVVICPGCERLMHNPRV